MEAIAARERQRLEQIGRGRAQGARITIALGDLYRRIEQSFEAPVDSEGFIHLDNAGDLAKPIETIGRHMDAGRS